MRQNPGHPADRGRSYRDIEKEAEKVRAFFEPDALKPLDCYSMFEALENFKVDTDRGEVPLSYGIEKLPHGYEGMTVWDEPARKIVVLLSEETAGALENSV